MASSLFPSTIIQSSTFQSNSTLKLKDLNNKLRKFNYAIKCEASESSSSNSKLEIGSAIIFVDAPQTIKTATSIPCLRVNTGFVKPGDVGRIVARKPKDVWAVRLTMGTYLIDGKHFKPLDIDE
ncbi:hypothetical protein MKW98_032642 [Papaver atlanticum]|uniref:Chlororespiratory reduction 42 n=1 Tax=Papaver atlanticum TaxID=357466 RepID=A0AAD4SWV3_9MAGN|nr:hypothetical protein MKW98_032642 [Papaver atlanticum]